MRTDARVSATLPVFVPPTASVSGLFESSGGKHMVVKVNRSRGADTSASGLFRRPRLVLRAQASRGHSRHSRQHQELSRHPCASSAAIIRRRAASAATAARPSTSARSTRSWNSASTRCGPRPAYAWARSCAALAERGQELPLTPEMGQMTLGAVAVTTLPQASYERRRRADVVLRQRTEARSRRRASR